MIIMMNHDDHDPDHPSSFAIRPKNPVGQGGWERSGGSGTASQSVVLLTHAGKARKDAVALSGPRNGDPRGREKNLHRIHGKLKILWNRTPGIECFGNSTGSKEHCTEDLVSKPTDSGTSSALALVQVRGNTVTPVAPPLQFSSEANDSGCESMALWGRWRCWRQMTSLKSDVVHLSAQMQQHDQRVIYTDRQLKDIAAGRS